MIARLVSTLAALGLVAATHAGPHDPEHAGVSGSASGPATHVLAAFENPGDLGAYYVVTGEVRTQDVAGSTDQPAYLETMNYFGGTGYFSKEMNSGGDLRSIGGSSDWRTFRLPFNAGDGNTPERVELRAILPGVGTVEIRGVRLVSAHDLGHVSTGVWWTNSAGAWIGAIAGTTLGLLGGLIGFLAWRRVDRRVTLGLLIAIIAAGGVAFMIGLIALALGQPYAVWYPPLLIGLIAEVVGVANYFALRKRYETWELQKLSAMDAAGA
jgi:hypothetical protein